MLKNSIISGALTDLACDSSLSGIEVEAAEVHGIVVVVVHSANWRVRGGMAFGKVTSWHGNGGILSPAVARMLEVVEVKSIMSNYDPYIRRRWMAANLIISRNHRRFSTPNKRFLRLLNFNQPCGYGMFGCGGH